MFFEPPAASATLYSRKRSVVPRIPMSLRDADIRAYPPRAYVGIVVFRPVKPSRDSVLALLKQLIPVLSAEWAERRLWIVEPGRVRIREGGSPAV